MVRVFRPSRSKSASNGQTSLDVRVDALDHSGVGVCRSHRPVIFARGGLPGELCRLRITDKKRQFWHARVEQVLEASDERQEPFCPHFELCGGCQTQHLNPDAALRHKTEAVDKLIKKVTGIRSLPWQAPITSQPTGYRRKARLAVDATGRTLKIGFRGQSSRNVVDIEQCRILTPALQDLLLPLKALVSQLSQPKAIGHVSLFDGSDRCQVVVRITRTLSEVDREKLRQFARQYDCELLLDKGNASVETLVGSHSDGGYHIGSLQCRVGPNDFVQVNGEVNQLMVCQAIEWLAPETGEVVWDLFSGVGNFSLPLAQQGAEIIGIEVSDAMVARARDNARANRLTNIRFEKADLSHPQSLQSYNLPQPDKVLLDPARAGASAVMPVLAAMRPKAVLYVSCNPATYARDMAELLANGWQVERIALMDMFPNTSHTELMALLTPVHR